MVGFCFVMPAKLKLFRTTLNGVTWVAMNQLERLMTTESRNFQTAEGLLRLSEDIGNEADLRAFKRMVRVYFNEPYDDLIMRDETWDEAVEIAHQSMLETFAGD